jgi:hypothetical protein
VGLSINIVVGGVTITLNLGDNGKTYRPRFDCFDASTGICNPCWRAARLMTPCDLNLDVDTISTFPTAAEATAYGQAILLKMRGARMRRLRLEERTATTDWKTVT